MLKVKLAMAIVGISSIHLLQTFINAANTSSETMLWQTVIHLTFVVSAVALALIDRYLSPKSPAARAPETNHHADGSAPPLRPQAEPSAPASTAAGPRTSRRAS